MKYSMTLMTAILSVASAIPFKRYDNVTAGAVIDGEDVTITIDKYVTTTLLSSMSSLELSGPSARNQGAITSTVTEYVTTTVDGSIQTTPISTYTTTIPDLVTTSTTTHYVTITENDGSSTVSASESNIILTEASEACVCVPSTVTATVTETSEKGTNQYSTVTHTVVSSYPLIGEFTMSDSTTTITSYVELTLTELSKVPVVTGSISEFSSFNNNTLVSTVGKRGYFYEF
ncbi:hypothetical protein OXX80_010978 [Metschnikowia pulcherrima]